MAATQLPPLLPTAEELEKMDEPTTLAWVRGLKLVLTDFEDRLNELGFDSDA